MSSDNHPDCGRAGRRRHRGRRALGGALVGALLAAAPAWAGTTFASGRTVGKHHHPGAHHKLGPLSGTWSGSYRGSFSGTFRLRWQEIGQGLSGTIAISGFGNAPTSIHGVVEGTSISFGTVGSRAVTYSGSVSGSSMSGTWKIKAGGQALGGGSWSASRSH